MIARLSTLSTIIRYMTGAAPIASITAFDFATIFMKAPKTIGLAFNHEPRKRPANSARTLARGDALGAARGQGSTAATTILHFVKRRRIRFNHRRRDAL